MFVHRTTNVWFARDNTLLTTWKCEVKLFLNHSRERFQPLEKNITPYSSRYWFESCKYPPLLDPIASIRIPGSVWIHIYWIVRVSSPYDSMRRALSGHPSNRLAAHNPHTCSSDILHPQSICRLHHSGYRNKTRGWLQGCLVSLYVHW